MSEIFIIGNYAIDNVAGLIARKNKNLVNSLSKHNQQIFWENWEILTTALKDLTKKSAVFHKMFFSTHKLTNKKIMDEIAKFENLENEINTKIKKNMEQYE